MTKPVPIDDSNFDQMVLKSKTPVLVDFWAPWCRPCLMTAPVLDELAEEYAGRLIFTKIDVDQNAKTATAYSIMSIPNLIIFKNGKPVTQIVGYKTKAELIENYPGFPQGISGMELGQLIHQQAAKYGLETLAAEATALELQGEKRVVITTQGKFSARAVIIASGSA